MPPGTWFSPREGVDISPPKGQFFDVDRENYSETPPLNRTRVVEEFLAERDEIMRHKWYESERAGRDVGYEYARVDWMLRHRCDWDRRRSRTPRGNGNK